MKRNYGWLLGLAAVSSAAAFVLHANNAGSYSTHASVDRVSNSIAAQSILSDVPAPTSDRHLVVRTSKLAE